MPWGGIPSEFSGGSFALIVPPLNTATPTVRDGPPVHMD